MTIPARAHFCWIGTRLPWAYVFAVLSAAERSELPEITLHHTDDFEDGPELAALRQAPNVRLSRTDPLAYLTETGRMLGVGDGLAVIYRGLERPVMRADILRAAILYREGGIYLDLDTITARSLRPLLDMRQFVGCEFIIWTLAARLSRSPLVWARHLTLDLMRKAIRNMPDGWEKFRRVERFYARGVNNAVMGTEANSPLFAEYLRAMLEVPLAPPVSHYALGPDLLQEVVDRYSGDDLALQAPEVFYPIPPEISEHWFRIGTPVRLDAVLSPGTRVVHWYASVRTRARVAQIDPAYVRAHRDDQLYSALACRCVQALPAG